MPTVLSALHYDEPYVAFGCDLLTTPDHLTWAINYAGGIYQYVEDGYLLQFDGQPDDRQSRLHLGHLWLASGNPGALNKDLDTLQATVVDGSLCGGLSGSLCSEGGGVREKLYHSLQ